MIAGGGFAMMAWKLAWDRTRDRQILNLAMPKFVALQRHQLTDEQFQPASFEYYRILDNATALWRIDAPERAQGISIRMVL